jgi:outer membrane beta-barrel protein
MLRLSWIAASSALALALPLAAFAQEKGADEEGDDSPPAVTDSGVRPTAEVQKGRPAPFARIADDEETIYSVQRKAYLVNSKLEITAFPVSFSFTDRFVQTYAPGASVTYHVAENFGLEVFGAYMLPNESGLTSEILEKGKLTPEIAKLTQQLWAAGLGVQWSPIYGKVQIAGTSLGNFNLYIGAGAGVGQTRVQCVAGLELDPERGFDPAPDDSGKAKCPMVDVGPEDPEDVYRVVYEPARLQFMGAFAAGMRFYFSNSIGLKLEFKDWLFSTRVYRPGTAEPTQRFTDAIRNNIYVNLGLTLRVRWRGIDQRHASTYLDSITLGRPAHRRRCFPGSRRTSTRPSRPTTTTSTRTRVPVLRRDARTANDPDARVKAEYYIAQSLYKAGFYLPALQYYGEVFHAGEAPVLPEGDGGPAAIAERSATTPWSPR